MGLEHFSAKISSSPQVQAMKSKMHGALPCSMIMAQEWVHIAPHLPNAVLLLVLFLQISNVEGKESKSNKQRKLHTKYSILLIMPER